MVHLLAEKGALVTLIFPISDSFKGGPPFAMTEDLVTGLLTKVGLTCELIRKVPEQLSHPGRGGKEAIAVWRKSNKPQLEVI